MIPRLVILVVLFIVVFEGRMIFTLLTHRVGSSRAAATGSQSTISGGSQAASSAGAGQSSAASSSSVSGSDDTPDMGLAGLAGSFLSSLAPAQNTPAPGAQTTQETQQEEDANGEAINSPAVVPAQEEAVDDSYFSNSVFIGDSRMEGFRNASGITQGTFLTGVGLSIGDMDKQIISTADGSISVYQGLSGRQYDRIYLMLGTNDLGFYPWENFQPTFEKVIRQFHELQPGATIYICSVIYVEEAKIAQGFEYDNNENVQTINRYILQTCEDLWYSYYINLNEIFSDGSHGLIPGASADGIHLEAEYCEQMLEYLKNHYIPDAEWQQVFTENGGSTAAASDETESSSEGSDDSSADSADSSADGADSSADSGQVTAG